MYKQLETPDPHPINYLYHLSDIHIRNQTRHPEYRQVFSELYKNLNKEPPGIVVITGDIVHSKSQISPQLIIELRNFLSNLAEIMPVVMIAGNHDLNLSNKDVPDTLSSILHKINIPNLYYLKDSGIYQWNNLLLGVMSVLDYPLIRAEEFPKIDVVLEDDEGNEKEIPSRIIGLLHATINGSLISTSTKPLTSDKYKVSDFEGYDCVLLGDIHLHQYMNASKTIAYAGSLIQQSFGEEIDNHGYLKWDLERKTSQLVPLPNKHAFLNIFVKNNRLGPSRWVETKSMVPPFVHLKIKMLDDSSIEIAESYIRDLSVRGITILQTIIVPFTPSLEQNEDGDSSLGSEVPNLMNLSNQNKLFEEYLGADYEKLEEIQDMHDRFSKEITNVVENNCYQWHLISVEFQNAFTFTGDNFIDFSEFMGIVGIIGPNFSGKSNLLDIILFGLFDHASRGERNDIITANKASMYIKINFRIGSTNYIIHRTGKVTTALGGDKTKIDVRFFSSTEELTGENRNETNKIIQSFIGNYEDFILTTLKLQDSGSGGNLISLGNSQRKEKLVELLRLNLLDEYYKIANNKLKDNKKEVEHYQKELNQLPPDLVDQLDKLLVELIDKKTKLNILKLNFDKEATKLNKLNSQLQPVDLEIASRSYQEVELVDPSQIRDLDKQLNKMNSEISQLESQIKSIMYDMSLLEFEDNLDLYQAKIEEKEREIKKIIKNEANLKVVLEGLQKSKEICRKKLIDWDKLWKRNIHLKEWIKNCQSNNKKLLNLEYDDECKYCMNNVFVKDAIRYRDELKEREEELAENEVTLTELEGTKSELAEIEDEIAEIQHKLSEQRVYQMEKELNTWKAEHEQLDKDYNNLIKNNRLNEEIAKKTNIYELEKKKRDELWDQWDLSRIMEQVKIEKKKEEANKGLRDEIEVLTETLNQMKKAKNQLEEEILNQSADEQVLGIHIERFRELTRKIKLLREDNEVLEVYTRCLNKDGIPKYLIGKYLPEFERVVNLIMQDLVNFKIKMEISEKKWNLYVVYHDRQLNLDLCSGYEKFVVGLAVKCALGHLSQVSKPQFMVIDEGFGTLDDNHLREISKILNFLRSKYQFVLLITHIETIKDEIDQQLEIKKMGEYSRVNNKIVRKLTIKKRSSNKVEIEE